MSDFGAQTTRTPLYVIGYPKSGNTWLARMLADATSSPMEVNDPCDAVNAADNSPDRIGLFLVKKKHDVNNEEMNELANARFVYIVRDVRDVLISGFFHCNRWAQYKLVTSRFFYKSYFYYEILGLNKKWQGNPIARLNALVIQVGSAFYRLIIGQPAFHKTDWRWSDHVETWINRPGAIVVRYENLLQDTENELKRILAALNIQVDDENVRRVAENQNFERKKKKFLALGDEQNAKFMRNGKAGEWKLYLPSGIVLEIEKRHGPMMKRMGYELPTNDHGDKQ